MTNADWIVTVRVRLRSMVVHDEPDAEATVRWVLDEENGFAGLCDWPEDFEIVSITPDKATVTVGTDPPQSEPPYQCPECGRKDAFDGMWHLPNCSKNGYPYG